jgi:hypothetical protein
MKRIISLLALVALVCAVPAPAQNGSHGLAVSSERYDGYFERNDSGLKGKTSYLAFTTRESFDKVFHPAPTMEPGEVKFLPDDAFGSKLVVATVRRGSFTSIYDVTGVEARGRTLYVRYDVKDEPRSGATFASPLILAVDRAHYSRVVFVEGGRSAAVVTLPRPRARRA